MTDLPFFVYGTLRVGFGNHSCFGNSVRTVTPATLIGASMVTVGFPYVWRTETGNVVGELITVDPDQYEVTQQRLDQLEGYRGANQNNHYDRLVVEVVLADGSTVQAYTYLVTADRAEGLTPVPSGDFADTRKPAFTFHDPWAYAGDDDIEIGDDVAWSMTSGGEKQGIVIDTFGDTMTVIFTDLTTADVKLSELRLSPVALV